jgi:hypothetical protein
MVDRLNMTARALGVALLLSGAVAAETSDPTRPPPGYSQSAAPPGAAATPQAAPLRVSSLFLLGDKPYALVDGQIVRTGDPLAEGKVAGIDARGVWIVLPDRSKRLLKWVPEVVKTPAGSPSGARMEKK